MSSTISTDSQGNFNLIRQPSQMSKSSPSKKSKNSKNSLTALGYSIHNDKKPVNFKDLIKGTFSRQFDHNMKEFFKDKKMLIIFDGFDLIVQQSSNTNSNPKLPMIRYPTFLLKTLIQLKVPIVFSSWRKLKLPHFEGKLSYFNLQPLTVGQSLI